MSKLLMQSHSHSNEFVLYVNFSRLRHIPTAKYIPTFFMPHYEGSKYSKYKQNIWYSPIQCLTENDVTIMY